MKSPPTPNDIRNHLDHCIQSVVDNRPCYVLDPISHMTRSRKLPFKTCLRLVLGMSALDNRNEISDFFLEGDLPSDSALCQQRAKILPEAFRRIFHLFSLSFESILKTYRGYRILAFDGSQLRYPYNPKEPDCAYPTNGKAHGNLNVAALMDCLNNLVIEARISSGTKIQEIVSLKDIVESKQIPKNSIIICDRLYENYELFAYFYEYNHPFIIRVKDITAHSGLSHLYAPKEQEEFDIEVILHLRRSNEKIYQMDPYHKYLNSTISFKYLENKEMYELKFRLIRFKIQKSDENSSYECIVTSLDKEKFSLEEIKYLYSLRWKEEIGFRLLKYVENMAYLHSKKKLFVEQEIWAAFIMHNLNALILLAISSSLELKENFQVDYSTLAFNVQLFFKKRLNQEELLLRIKKFLTKVRPGRKYKRLIRRQGPQPFNYR